MSVVVAQEEIETFFEHCRKENIEATVIARITDDNRLKIKWNAHTIVDICRKFINTSGVRQKTNITVMAHGNTPNTVMAYGNTPLQQQRVIDVLSDLNVASQQNMIEMFDSTIGATTVLMPFGGKYQLTETQAGVQKLPVRHGYTDTCSILTFGYNPFISECSPFHGAQYAIIESMAKLVAVGGDYRKIRFTFQEYFEKLGKDAEKWGKPFAALLGAIIVQNFFHLPAIGGKDSMSGTFKELNVPPTLVSFAVATQKASNIISPEFKKTGNYIYLIKHQPDELGNPNLEQLKQLFDFMVVNIQNKKIISAFTCQFGGIIEALCKMGFGNNLGFNIQTQENLFCYNYGSFIVETEQKLNFEHAFYLGEVADSFIINSEKIDKAICLKKWQQKDMKNV
jgi:phosphoribosylformylglycinamidine synthase